MKRALTETSQNHAKLPRLSECNSAVTWKSDPSVTREAELAPPSRCERLTAFYAATPTAILGRSLDKSCHLTEAELFPICRERRFCADDIIHEFDGNHG